MKQPKFALGDTVFMCGGRDGEVVLSWGTIIGVASPGYNPFDTGEVSRTADASFTYAVRISYPLAWDGNLLSTDGKGVFNDPQAAVDYYKDLQVGLAMKADLVIAEYQARKA